MLGYWPSRNRKEANLWFKRQASDIKGKVLSIGSGADDRHYFINALYSKLVYLLICQ